MKQLLTIATFLSVSIFSFAQVQVSYIEDPYLGKTPIFIGGYVIPDSYVENSQRIKAVNDAALIRLFNKNNELVGIPPDNVLVYSEKGEYLGFYAYKEKTKKTIITLYSGAGYYLARWAIPKASKE